MSDRISDKTSEPPSAAPPACVLPVPPRPCVATAEGGAFAVRRIYAVGHNDAAHAREMGNDDRQQPVFFLKPADTVIVPDACYLIRRAPPTCTMKSSGSRRWAWPGGTFHRRAHLNMSGAIVLDDAPQWDPENARLRA